MASTLATIVAFATGWSYSAGNKKLAFFGAIALIVYMVDEIIRIGWK